MCSSFQSLERLCLPYESACQTCLSGSSPRNGVTTELISTPRRE